MKRRRTILLSVLFLLSIINLMGCNIDDLKKFVGFKVDETRNLIVLVDLSSSPSFPDRHLFYKGVITGEIFSNLGEKDRLTVIPVDRASVTNAEEIFISNLSEIDFTPEVGSPLEIDRLTKEALERYKVTLLSEFEVAYDRAVDARKPLDNETDLFGAIESVGRYTLSDRPTYVILLSDMMHFTRSLSMETTNRAFTLDKIDDFVSKAPKVSLAGYTVLVLTGDQSGSDPAHFRNVETFWTKYFEQNGAKLFDYGSQSRSKVVELLRYAKARE